MLRKPGRIIAGAAMACLLLFQEGCQSAASSQGPLSRLKVTDSWRRPAHPFANSDKATVFIFLATECPISNKYAPEISRLYARFKDTPISFYLVYPNVDDIPEMIQSHTKDYGYAMSALYDPEHKLVKLARARVTPEAAVFLPGGRLVYHGRIDDRFPSLGVARPQSTLHDLESVLAMVAENKNITPTETKAIGCYIPQ